jgi:uncharacterized small protein (TIGR04563 family)
VAEGTKRKQNVYFSEVMLEEIAAEAVRLDRSISWIIQDAWRIARRMRSEPSADEVAGEGTVQVGLSGESDG